MTDSSTGGYLPPLPAPAPLEGKQLAIFLQNWIVGCSGLPGPSVRPAWQPEPPDIPNAGTVWASFQIGPRQSDIYPYITHNAAGYDILQRHETLNLLLSFYDLGISGQADLYASQFRDGTAIAQNREVLFNSGMGLVRVGDLIPVPTLVKTRWVYRVDVPVVIRREIDRNYAVLNLQSAHGILYTDTGLPPQPF